MTQQVTSRFPAIFIGGWPNAGKSVLSYSLRQSLGELGLEFYLLRTAPDGEGDWYLESPPQVARAEQRKGKYTDHWIKKMSQALAYRPLPYLVDVGGLPNDHDAPIFDQCTHAILLVKEDKPIEVWQEIVDRYNLIPLAVLTSRLEGEAVIESRHPVLHGTITGLVRGQQAAGPVYEALLQRVRALFEYSPAELKHIYWSQAPAELVVDIDTMFRFLRPDQEKVHWDPTDLPDVLDYLPNDQSLALYGRGPGWLYAAVAAHIAPHPFYQFDARLGWVSVVSFEANSQNKADLSVAVLNRANQLQLKFAILEQYLDYEVEVPLALPAPPLDRGVVLNGALPNWCYTGLTRFYQAAPWVGIFSPRLSEAIIVASQEENGPYQIGQTVAVES